MAFRKIVTTTRKGKTRVQIKSTGHNPKVLKHFQEARAEFVMETKNVGNRKPASNQAPPV